MPRPSLRAASTLLLVLVGGCSGAHDGAVGPQPAPTSAPVQRSGATGETQLADALQAASTFTSVHLAITFSGDLTGGTDLDAGAGTGMTRTATSAVSVQVRCRSGACWVLGDAAGLEAAPLGLAPAVASAHAGRWLRVRPGSGLAGELGDTITLAAALRSIRLTGQLLDAGPTEVAGVPVEAIKGLDPDGRQAETVYVAQDSGLPVGFLEVGATRTTTGTFSAWGEAVDVPVPQRVLPFP